jgi:hypothetical protein
MTVTLAYGREATDPARVIDARPLPELGYALAHDRMRDFQIAPAGQTLARDGGRAH